MLCAQVGWARVGQARGEQVLGWWARVWRARMETARGGWALAEWAQVWRARMETARGGWALAGWTRGGRVREVVMRRLFGHVACRKTLIGGVSPHPIVPAILSEALHC